MEKPKLNLEQERLKGVLEMAGSICHELNQPLQAIVGYTELIKLDIHELQTNLELTKKIDKLITEIDRISIITKKLAHIKKYKTKTYPGGVSIIDIDKSSTINLKD